MIHACMGSAWAAGQVAYMHAWAAHGRLDRRLLSRLEAISDRGLARVTMYGRDIL